LFSAVMSLSNTNNNPTPSKDMLRMMEQTQWQLQLHWMQQVQLLHSRILLPTLQQHHKRHPAMEGIIFFT
jgi:hypothetical protein